MTKTHWYVVLVFAAMATIFAAKYWVHFVEQRHRMGIKGSAYDEFSISVTFPDVSPEVVAQVEAGDTMLLRTCPVARVVSKREEVDGRGGRSLVVTLSAPNWARCYVDTSRGRDLVFVTDKYSLRGRVE